MLFPLGAGNLLISKCNEKFQNTISISKITISTNDIYKDVRDEKFWQSLPTTFDIKNESLSRIITFESIKT